MRLFFKSFDSKMASREKLFKAAVEYANQLGRDRILTLSHSEDRDNIVITIWYWAEDELKPIDLKKLAAQAARTGTGRPAELGKSDAREMPLGLSGGFVGLDKELDKPRAELPPSMDESQP
jgi:hypothetical protein